MTIFKGFLNRLFSLFFNLLFFKNSNIIFMENIKKFQKIQFFLNIFFINFFLKKKYWFRS